MSRFVTELIRNYFLRIRIERSEKLVCCILWKQYRVELNNSDWKFFSGVVRNLHDRNRLLQCYCTETRPYNQGSRLTAYELVCDKIPSVLICDDMAASLMKQRNITAVILGADRVAANGDTANKIGTYQLAVLAKYHGVLFYVAAPSTSIDLAMETGEEIVIEERPHKEMTTIQGISLAPEGENSHTSHSCLMSIYSVAEYSSPSTPLKSGCLLNTL